MSGNAILTERTIPAPVMLGTGAAVSLLLAALLWLLAQVGALYREVGRLARTDSLTGVANRRAWDEELPRELAGRPAPANRSAWPCSTSTTSRPTTTSAGLRTAQPEGTCSIGLADWDGREDATQLITRADRALYAAKAAGRNRGQADGAEPAVPTPAS